MKLLRQITNLLVHSMLTLPVILFGHKGVCSKLLFEITIIVGGKDFAGGSPFGNHNILHCTQIIGRERSIGQCFCLGQGDSIVDEIICDKAYVACQIELDRALEYMIQQP